MDDATIVALGAFLGIGIFLAAFLLWWRLIWIYQAYRTLDKPGTKLSILDQQFILSQTIPKSTDPEKEALRLSFNKNKRILTVFLALVGVGVLTLIFWAG